MIELTAEQALEWLYKFLREGGNSTIAHAVATIEEETSRLMRMTADYLNTGVPDMYRAIRRRHLSMQQSPWFAVGDEKVWVGPESKGAKELLQSGKVTLLEFQDAADWVEAENTFAVREVISEWFDALESGKANQRYPNPRKVGVSSEKADKLVSELDEDFEIESNRYYGLQVEKGPEFFRLLPHARLAFAESVFSATQSEEAIEQEVVRRLVAGVETPPKDQRVFLSWDAGAYV